MKSLSLFILLVLTFTACDKAQKPKIKNPLAGHVKALEKAKNIESLIQKSTENRLKQVDNID